MLILFTLYFGSEGTEQSTNLKLVRPWVKTNLNAEENDKKSETKAIFGEGKVERIFNLDRAEASVLT